MKVPGKTNASADADGMETQLVRVVAPHFVAGLIMRDGRCTHAAPILKWCRGACRETLAAEFRRKGWVASVLR